MRAGEHDPAAAFRRSAWIPPLCVIAFTLVVAPAGVGAGAQEEPTVQPAVLQDSPLTDYRAFRRMQASNEKFNQEAWLDAWTERDASGFRYEIVSARGSEYILNKVLKTMLAREQELIASGQEERAELSAENYEFAAGHAGDRNVQYVMLKPRRKDMLLVDGRMVLTPDGTQLLRVEGRLARTPSFWISLVNVIREFARVDGVRVPVTTETIAKLKLAGLSRMTVRYEYERINGRAVSSVGRRALASAASGR